MPQFLFSHVVSMCRCKYGAWSMRRMTQRTVARTRSRVATASNKTRDVKISHSLKREALASVYDRTERQEVQTADEEARRYRSEVCRRDEDIRNVRDCWRHVLSKFTASVPKSTRSLLRRVSSEFSCTYQKKAASVCHERFWTSCLASTMS